VRQQALSFCRKLARAMYIQNHYNEWLLQVNSEILERLKAIRTQVEAVIGDVKKEAPKFQLRCERTQVLTVGVDNIPTTWYNFQLTNSFNFKVDKLLSLVEKFAGVTVPKRFKLQFEIGFIGKHVTYRTTNNIWKIHVSGARHLAVNDVHTLFFDIEYVENAHPHLIGFDLGHELLHSLLKIRDKDMEDLDFKFYESNKNLLENEGFRFMKGVFFKSDDFFKRVSNLTNTPILRSVIKTLDSVISDAYLNLNFPFSPDFTMKGDVPCHLCGSPLEFVMS
jgi:hypothetical protein